ncbi:MAG: EutN/CcmL family microcompartment protein [Pseudomonadota bacterium]
MRIARVTGTATASVKAPGLSGLKLLVLDLEDGAGGPGPRGIVAADTVGAGVGERVILAEGSAARLPAATAGQPVDAAVIAILDRVDRTE